MDRPQRQYSLRSRPPHAAKLNLPFRQTRSVAKYLNSCSPSSDNPSDVTVEAESDINSQSLVLRTLPPSRKRKNPANDEHDEHDDYAPPPKKAPRRSRQAIKEPTDEKYDEEHDKKYDEKNLNNLPYHVILAIFDAVAAPIRDTSSRREDVSEAVNTLLSAAKVSKNFSEPALASLYRCPPFYHPWRYTKHPNTSFSQFMDTLNRPSGMTWINYHPKVEILRLEAGATLRSKHLANLLDLQGVVCSLPRLSHLELYHSSDEPPYRKLDEKIRLKIEASDLLRALVSVSKANGEREVRSPPLELKSWRWSARLTSVPLSRIASEYHSMNPSLQKVAFVNFQLASWGLPARVQQSEEMQVQDSLKISELSVCISSLPRLEHLVLESSTLVNDSLLSRLPTTLKQLELINCWEVTGQHLGEFLVTHGNSLRRLTLNHCQSLSLEFLPVLRSSCPNLEHLYMDLSYFRHHEHYADNKPEYETLLTEDQVPTWPTSIQSIEILHMRKWGRKAAETFFGSLVQSAPDLPHLRRLSLRIALDISWRQRLQLRELWVDKLVKIFKRKPKPLRGSKMGRPAPAKSRLHDQKEPKPKSLKPKEAPKRRSARIAELPPSLPSSEAEVGYVSQSHLTRVSAMTRELKQLKGSGLLLKEHDADDEDSEDELAADHFDRARLDRKTKKVPKPTPFNDGFIHGLCTVVDIQVDNHRPTEHQYDMEDFLDSPDESETEWDGGDEDIFD
ncbi:hypothetical protein GGR54DRAFT_582229 [Hypoxylon sp. NC1633]|nr:hypothetical protein GGR54DRAFT_582229 [Hypoxylon sp. NC1633]